MLAGGALLAVPNAFCKPSPPEKYSISIHARSSLLDEGTIGESSDKRTHMPVRFEVLGQALPLPYVGRIGHASRSLSCADVHGPLRVTSSHFASAGTPTCTKLRSIEVSISASTLRLAWFYSCTQGYGHHGILALRRMESCNGMHQRHTYTTRSGPH